jgi:hypothetical protein
LDAFDTKKKYMNIEKMANVKLELKYKVWTNEWKKTELMLEWTSSLVQGCPISDHMALDISWSPAPFLPVNTRSGVRPARRDKGLFPWALFLLLLVNAWEDALVE